MFNKIKLIIVSLFFLFSSRADAQLFTELTSNNLGTYNGDLVLADLDRNDTLDLILVGVDSLGLDVLRIYNVDTAGNLIIAKQVDIPSIKDPLIKVSDLTNNGFIDLIITGTVNDVPYYNILLNKSNFEFEDYSLELPNLNGGLVLADFTNNGFIDFIVNSNQLVTSDTTQFYSNQNGLFTLCDTCNVIPLKNISLLDIDVDNNGFTDFILSGLDSDKMQKYYLYKNVNNLRFDTMKLPFEEIHSPEIIKGDFTQNGFMDVIIGGKVNGEDSLIIYKNNGSGFEFELGIGLEDSIVKMLPADFTNDGLLDILMLSAEQLMLYFNDGTGGYDTTIVASAIGESSVGIGDFDRDNDQDIFITGVKRNKNIFQLYKNENPINARPTSPDQLYAFPLGDSVVLQWNDGSDSTTIPQSLSYNAFITRPNGSVMPIHSGRNNRSLSEFGMQSLSNELTIKNLKPEKYQWFIQAIDNSLVDPFGICNGGASGSCSWVFEIKEETDYSPYSVCKTDTINIAIDPPQVVQWFSKNIGMLSVTDTLVYVGFEDDVVYANYTNDGCETKTFVAYIEILTTESIDISDQEICKGENINFDISNSFESANWTFQLTGDTISGSTVSITPVQSDSLVIDAIAESGCVISKTIFVKVNELPTVDAGEDVSIFNGESISLLASGAETYKWSPSSWLNNSQIANPVSAPKETITYTVLGLDANNCFSQDDVVVNVKESVFIPNLFSPNGDGNNDRFKVYGNNVEGVLLKVYDLKGKLLYKSNGAAISEGWDGNFNGKPVPQGNYLWVISGKYPDGSMITSDGKVSGSLTLIR